MIAAFFVGAFVLIVFSILMYGVFLFAAKCWAAILESKYQDHVWVQQFISDPELFILVGVLFVVFLVVSCCVGDMVIDSFRN